MEIRLKWLSSFWEKIFAQFLWSSNMFLDMFIVKSLLCTKDRSNLKSLTLAVNWWCEAFLPYSFNYILYVFSCCFNSCYLPSLLQMLSSKDVNFMGYTYKNFEIVNDHEVPGISNLSCPFLIFSLSLFTISPMGT